MKNPTLIVMAAGMGSRFGGLKQLEPIGKNGEALLDFSVYDAKKAGFGKVVFVIKREIEADFRRLVGKRIEQKIDVDYVFQELDCLPAGFSAPAGRVKPWGTGHAVLCCRDIVKEPFAVINADDYYGKTAYTQIYHQLSQDADNYCMVGFRLQNTLTENGTVSRGVCSIKDGMLEGIEERTKILDCKYTTDGTNWIPMAPETIVAMNMWGFTPDLFGYLEADFVTFLKARGNEQKSEFFLPFVIDDLIKSGKKQVRVLVAEDKWYGVTYREDKDAVQSALLKMVDAGEYDGI